MKASEYILVSNLVKFHVARSIVDSILFTDPTDEMKMEPIRKQLNAITAEVYNRIESMIEVGEKS